MTSNEEEGVCYAQPKTLADRLRVANAFVTAHQYFSPLLVDGVENVAEEIYAGWPERLYVVDEHGLIAYKGGPGPFGYEPDEVEAWLAARFPDVPADVAER